MIAPSPPLNALKPEFEKLLPPEYVAEYNKHVVGRRLAHQRTIEENRNDPVIVSFGVEKGPEVGSIEDVQIPVNGGKITLRIYRPAEAGGDEERKLPVHLNFHGGGWVIGQIGDDDPWIRRTVVRTGAIIIDVGYRLAPEHRFPIPIEDGWAAFQWVRSNSEPLGVYPKRISIGGFSAGGHMAAVIAQRARDEGIEGVCFCLMVIPVTDATAVGKDLEPAPSSPHVSWRVNYDCPFLSHARMSYFYRHLLPPNWTASTLACPTLSPLLHPNFKNLPPTLVVTAEIDVLRSEGEAYARRLQEEGDGWAEHWCAMGVAHPFPHQTGVSERAREFVELSGRRMEDAFAGRLVRGG